MNSKIHELDSTSFDSVGRIQQLSQCLGRKKTWLKSACTCPPLVISFRWLSVWMRSHVCFTVVFYRGPGQSWFEAGSSHSLRSCPETPWKCCTSQELLLVGAWKQLWLICDMEYTKSFTFLFACNIERQYQSICISTVNTLSLCCVVTLQQIEHEYSYKTCNIQQSRKVSICWFTAYCTNVWFLEKT